jgi:antitoxin ParD1/3/4
MPKTSSLSLGAHFEAFVSRQVESGQYASPTDVVRAGLRLLEERETKLESLRRALQEGEDSGTSDYSLEALLAELEAEGPG